MGRKMIRGKGKFLLNNKVRKPVRCRVCNKPLKYKIREGCSNRCGNCCNRERDKNRRKNMTKGNLSDMIGDWSYNDNGIPDEPVLSVEDVKEFIKEIYAKLQDRLEFLEYFKGAEKAELQMAELRNVKIIIDKLAGDKLR